MMRTRRIAPLLGFAGLAGFGVGVAGMSVNKEELNSVAKPTTALVIGGGIMGLSTSLQLAERGVQVTLLEVNPLPAQVASYYNGAIICNSMAASWASATLIAKNPGELKTMKVGFESWTDPNFYRWCAWFWMNSLWPGRAEFNHQSQRLLSYFSYKSMQEEKAKYGDKLFMNETAKETIKLFYNAEEMNEFLSSNQAKFWAEHGLGFRQISAQDCIQLEPGLRNVCQTDGIVGGVVCPSDSSGDIGVYCSNLEKLCKELGVKIMYNSGVEKLIKRDEQIVSAQLSNGQTMSADVYVLCVGVGSKQLGETVGINLPVYPLKGHLATIHSNPDYPSLTRNILDTRYGLISPLNPTSIRLSGRVEAVGYNYAVEPEKGKQLAAAVKMVFKPNFLRTDEATYHSCLRPVSGDDLAIIGQTKIQNLFVNTGQGSKGWTYSWGSSKLIAQIICGEETNLDPTRFSPLRFHPFRGYLG
ncbi:uncharacterized protein LOC111703577 isoform X2 [Eurytemora carolleeae]|uniref:uncharacterized protein LOC111703577 isoform X2 n=1 Tax=Eurytemora carolleeae TaxID=1294199 RepID=UPI000C776B3C|nr:uncharacterized protein LOC111703577 isoform X2 [Eurytemora carolleeae]|eukprot:XP_023331328.1 uncharacterized protein LOC111703577 isoform X2 [Eurytemora affinis]